jgi:hypothetical protein
MHYHRVMKMTRNEAGWAVKIWAVATVFTLPFMPPLVLFGWLGLGAVLGLVWKVLPEGPEPPPVGKLPYHDQYADRQIPRREKSPPQ